LKEKKLKQLELFLKVPACTEEFVLIWIAAPYRKSAVFLGILNMLHRICLNAPGDIPGEAAHQRKRTKTPTTFLSR
jgi:hypothetical protein